MPAVNVQICNAALVMVGDQPVATLDGDQVSQVVCSNLYPSVVADLLGRYRWRFASDLVQLQRLDFVPLAKWEGAYQVPVGAHTVHSVMIRDEAVDFDRFSQRIYCDAGVDDVLVAEVSIIPPEEEWPPYFRTLVELQLAAVIAFPITEDSQKASLYEGKALRQFVSAKTLDAQARTARVLRTGGLRRYHGGRP